MSDDYAIYEIPPLAEWIDKSILEINFRAKYHVNILGIKDGKHTEFLPQPNHTFKENQHLMIVGKESNVDKILKKL